MTITLDPASASISVDKLGAKADIHVGRELVLLHCTRNANRAAADSPNGGRPYNGNMIKFTGSVFLRGNPASAEDRLDITDWRLAFVQAADVMVFEFGFAGRMDNEGSVMANLRAAYLRKNPSFDGEPSFDDAFDEASMDIQQVTGAQSGFRLTVTDGDHPTQTMYLKFINRLTNSPNYLFSARRDEGFITYLVARDPAKNVHFLARVGWHVIWHGEFNWSAPSVRPAVTMKDSRIDVGQVRLGTPDASDAMFRVARQPTGPSTGDLMQEALDAIEHRRAPVLQQSRDRPASLPEGFFPK